MVQEFHFILLQTIEFRRLEFVVVMRCRLTFMFMQREKHMTSS
jgi:hypothetical protein